MRELLSIVVACVCALVLSAQAAFSPARYRTGAVPVLPAMAVGGGEVLLELAVNAEGRVTALTPLRTTPPFAELLASTARDWRFRPAEEEVTLEPGRAGGRASHVPVASTVLVAGIFRPPALNAPTLGEIPRDVATASNETALPLTTVVPPFPPLARSAGVVLVEVRVDRDGAVADAIVIRSAPPFDEPARTTALQWSFRPARVRGMPVPAFAYIVFGFPVPVSTPPRVPRRQ